jgi:hypothetical protein
LPSARLDQPEGKAQTVDSPETSSAESDVRGKSDDSYIVDKDCTVAVDRSSELEKLRSAIPNTQRVIISFERQSVQMFFSPENALTDIRRKVKELWNIPKRLYYLCANGVHEASVKSWKSVTAIQVKVRGLLGGSPIRYRYATRFEGKRTKGSGPVIQTAREIAEKLKIPTQGMRVNHSGHVFPMSASLRDIFGEEDNGTFDFEKGRCHEITIEHPRGKWKGFGKGEQSFAELATLEGWDLDDGDLLRDDGELFHASDQIRDAANWETPTFFRWEENEERAFRKGISLRSQEAGKPEALAVVMQKPSWKLIKIREVELVSKTQPSPRLPKK